MKSGKSLNQVNHGQSLNQVNHGQSLNQANHGQHWYILYIKNKCGVIFSNG
jgi:hypothetical protein